MPHVWPPPWTVFQWGSRGLYHSTGEDQVAVAHVFVPNCVEAMLEVQGPGGQQWLHKIHARAPNLSPDYTDCLTVAQTVATWWNGQYRNMVGTTVTPRRVVATAIDAMPSAQATVYLTLIGLRSGVVAPSEVSCSVLFFTHMDGRRNHGGARSYPPVLSDIGASDRFTSAYLGAIQGVWQNLINALNTAGYPMVIFSREDVAIKTIAGVVAVDDVIDSQRRRTINRGR